LLNLGPYKTLFSDCELKRIVLASILPRLPAGINGLSLTLMVQSLYGSFAIGGTISAAYLMALGVLPLLQDQQLGLMVWSPLAGGLLSGKFSPDGTGPEGTRRASFDFPLIDKPKAFRVIDVMRPIAQQHQVSVSQVALAWLLSRPQVSTVIMGAKTPEQLADNLGAGKLELSADELKALDEVSAMTEEYPGWMLARQALPRIKPPVKN